MKRRFTFLMAFVAMFLCASSAWAETLYFAFGGGTASDALDGGANQTWTSNEHAGYSWAITGNTAKGISGANKVNAAPYYDGNLTTFKNSNGAQNTFYMPEGVEICNIKFIGYTNALESEGTCTLKEINGVDVTENNTIAVYKDDATMVDKVLGTPGVIDYTFPEPVSGSFTFTMGGKQGCFIIVIETLGQELEDPDYTGSIVNADLSTTDGWNAEGTKGIKDGMVKVGSQAVYDFSQTITLPAGQYMMTAKSVYRYGSDEQAEYDAILAGTETHKTKLYAETSSYKYEADVQNRYDGASDTDYAAGSGSVTINGKFVPNSSAAVQAWFNNGQYVNELVFNVQEEGQVKIGITTIDGIAGDYTNIGAWTLTRLGEAEADPKEEEPTPETSIYTMVQNEADLVAGAKYLIMAEVNGGWVALSDQSGKIRVPSDTLAVSENFTVETIAATAIAGSPALFAGEAYELTLEGEAGAWRFKDELNGAYLHWASGNNLTNDAEGSTWTIAFNQYAHNAVITHAVTTDRVLQYNASSPRFCAYTSVQKPVYLFKAGEVTVAPVAPSNPSFNTIAELLAFEIGNVVELNVNNAKITYLSGNNMSITDGTDTLAIYDYNIPAEYVVEGFLSGTITATLGEYKGNKQLTVVDWSEVTFVEPFSDFYTNPSGEEALESLGNIELFFFDLVENVVVSEEVQATLTTPTYEASVWTSLYVNDADPENTFNYICFELEETYTEPGEYVLNIPAGLFTVDGAPNAETQVYFTVKAAGLAFDAEIVGVTPVEGEVTELSEIIVQFSNDQVMLYSNIFLTDEAGAQYEFELDINHPDYTQAKFVAKDGAITAAGTYTLDCSQIDHMNMMTGALSYPFTGTYSWTIVASAGKKVVYNLDVERVAGLGYAAEDYTIATSELAALLGVESLGEATIWGVNPDGSYVADAMNTYDGWRAVDGTFAGWSSETAAVCVKLFAEEAAYLVSICTHAGNGNDPVAGTQSTAVWALVAGADTVVINTNITFVEPAVLNIADFEVVSTIKVEHNETVGVPYSANTASFDPVSAAAALGVASLTDADQYILNVTDGSLVINSTDGWRDANGDASPWGAEGGVCVKISDPASGSIDYIGCIDTKYVAGDVYTAKWAFVHEGKAVVIEVVITFIPADGIENIEAAEDAVIYTITGKRVQGNVKSLERGIYIVNGKKVYVK